MVDAQGYNRKPVYHTPRFPIPFKLDERALLHEATYHLKRAPIVGKWISRASNITGLFMTNNSPGAYVVAQAFFVSLPRLLYTFAKPFPEAEALYQFLNKRCGQKKGIIPKQRRPIKVPGGIVNPLYELSYLGEEQAIYQLPLEFWLHAQWWIFLIDRATEFEYNWVSLAYQYNRQLDTGAAYWNGGTSGQINLTADQQVVMHADDYQNCFNAPTGPTVFEGFGTSAGFTASLDQPYQYAIFKNGVQLHADPPPPKRTKGGPFITQDYYDYQGEPNVGAAVWSLRCLDPYIETPHGDITFTVGGNWYGKPGLVFDP